MATEERQDHISHSLRSHVSSVTHVVHVIDASEDRSGEVRGLTVHGVELFIVRFPSEGRIEVYNAANFTFQRYIEVKELCDKDVQGLTSCDTNHCLYISEHDDYILRVDLDGENEVIKWKIEDDSYEPRGLSVNRQHNLLVTCWYQPHKLIEYTTRGELVREIRLPDNVEWPGHAIQLGSNQFIVCHGDDTSLHRVSIVNSNKRVLFKYGDIIGSKAGQLNVPTNLAVGGSGFIFVADSNNHRIVVLDSKLKRSRDLKINDVGVKFPYSLYLDEQLSQLFIGECNDKSSRIVVVKV